MESNPSLIESPAWRKQARPRVLLWVHGHGAVDAELRQRVVDCVQSTAETIVDEGPADQPLGDLEADFAVVLGGDGSILRAACRLAARQIPILGVNVGKLGFLADVSPERFERTYAKVVKGNCRIVSHLMFRCRIERDGGVLQEQLGLNETAILAGPPYSILDIDLRINGDLVTTYSCDGLLISTPVGSTAHSLSAGGPILQKSLHAFVICPLSPHTLTVRPLVDSADHSYEMLAHRPHDATSVVVDGRWVHPLRDGDKVIVEKAAPRFQLIEVAGHGYYRTLREKLGWAGQMRKR